jgi:hypothetical protein
VELTRPRGSANVNLQSFMRNTLPRLASNDLFDVSFAFDKFGLRLDNERHRFGAYVVTPQMTGVFPFLSQPPKLPFISGPSFDDNLHDMLPRFKKLASRFESNRNNVYRTASLKRFPWLKNNKFVGRLSAFAKSGPHS